MKPQRSLSRITILLIVILGFLGSLVALAPASNADPSLRLSASDALLRLGGRVEVAASGLQPGTRYDLSTDHGGFDSAATVNAISFTAPGNGSFTATVVVLSTVAISTVQLALSLAGDTSTVSSLNIPVAPPVLTLYASACPGQLYNTVIGIGVVDGDYVMHSDGGTFNDGPAHALNGAFEGNLMLPASAPANFTVSVSTDAQSPPIATQQFALSPAYLSDSLQDDPWTGKLSGGCFAPGEQVQLTPSASVKIAASVVADSSGKISVPMAFRPDLQLATPATVIATGQISDQHASFDRLRAERNTLLAGQSLGGPVYDGSQKSIGEVLATATRGYTFEPSFCKAPVQKWAATTKTIAWSARLVVKGDPGVSGCSLNMQLDGNAVLYSAAGASLWSTGTSGTGNRLILQNNGGLQVLGSNGTALWSSALAPSYASAAASRRTSAVYVNGLVQQRAPTGPVIRSVHRTAYLQRYLAGRWQNLLTRTTDSNGQLAVGFIQASRYQYRWLVPATPSQLGTASNQVLE
jgi:hypothetical protein